MFQVLSVSSVMDHLAAKLTRHYPDLGLLGDIMEVAISRLQ